jgi:uncharacterized protein YjlB
MNPEIFHFADDGTFPNGGKYPLLVYRQVFLGSTLASTVEERFAANGWTNSWRNGVYPFHHYHSTSHEVLGVYAGSALLTLGGPQVGKQLHVAAGDILVLPAGVAHQCIRAEAGFGVVGAYPDGRHWDLLRGQPGDRPQADQNIAALPLPTRDPVGGESGKLRQLWTAA